MFYAGIGSRETPQHVLEEMKMIGTFLAKRGYVLRSGGAPGADSAFEQGCNIVNGKKEIFVPWKNFNGNKSELIGPSPEAYELASTVHPVYRRLSTKGRMLIARNMHQILGKNLNTPVDFVVCWTSDGCENETEYSIKTGGTGSAIVLASRHNIPVYNIYKDSSLGFFLSIIMAATT